MGRAEGLMLVIVEGGLLAVVCFYLLRYYKAHYVPIDVSFTVYLSWIFGLAGIIYLPYDLSVALDGANTNNDTLIIWNCIYWSTFVLAWFILPMQMEFHSSGHFTFNEKLLDSFRRNLTYLLITFILLLLFIVFMVVSGADGDVRQVIGFLMAMSNTYGIFVITVLLGSGLVTFPRLLWQTGFPLTELTKLYITAEMVESAFQDARFALEDCELEVMQVASKQAVKEDYELSKCSLILQKEVADFEFSGRALSRGFRANSGANGSDVLGNTIIDKTFLVTLNARYKQAQMRVRAAERKWKNHVHRARKLEHQSRAYSSTQTLFCFRCSSWPANATWQEKLSYLKDCFSTNGISLWESTSLACFRILALTCATASAVLLWSELVMETSLSSPFGLLMESLSHDSADFIAIQMIAILTLAYMSVCMYWSLFRLNLGAMYSLQGPQLSLPPSLIFNAQYFSRLQFTLGYNFLVMLNIEGTDITGFDVLMRNMKTIPVFGNEVITYVPIAMTLIALITMLNGYARLLRLVGIESEETVTTGLSCCGYSLSEADEEQIETGKKIITLALRGMGIDEELGGTQNPMRSRSSTPLRSVLPMESPSIFKYRKQAEVPTDIEDNSLPDTGYAIVEDDHKEETVDFSVLFTKKKKSVSKSPSVNSLTAAAAATSTPPLEDDNIDPFNEAIGAGLSQVASFFKNISKDQSLRSFWGQQRVNTAEPEEEDEVIAPTARLSAADRRLAEMELAKGKSSGTTSGRYK